MKTIITILFSLLSLSSFAQIDTKTCAVLDGFTENPIFSKFVKNEYTPCLEGKAGVFLFDINDIPIGEKLVFEITSITIRRKTAFVEARTIPVNFSMLISGIAMKRKKGKWSIDWKSNKNVLSSVKLTQN